ncbi:MAG: aminotransferase class V-fold PLP-dependent enzyme, partial [Acidobacteria bacterium]|nr:aminotransferase class V-fold PLP-dependent enzyme [Acidobacteriota bacterium]
MTELPALRERFPGAESVWARFDGPAGTLVLDAVIDATATWQSGVNPSNTGGAFSMSEACTALIADARAAVGTLLGASAESIVWGPSATQLITNVSRAVADGLSPGDEIVCTELDHEANISPWRLVARERGLELRFARLDAQTGEMKLAAVEEAMSERTRWVAVSGASNVLGTIPDLRAIADLAHEAGARVLVDGVHLTPHCPVDVGALGCDVFVTSAYKWFGPHLSAMYADPALRDALEIHLLGDFVDYNDAAFQSTLLGFRGDRK